MLPIPSLRLGLGLVVALALMGTHLAAWQAGQDHVQSEWNAAQAEDATARAAAQAQARQREQTIVKNLQTTEDHHAQEVARRTAAERSARTELDSLRAQASALATGAAGASAATCSRADAAPALADVFGQCAGALQSLAGEADRLAGQVIGLQGYVRATKVGD